MLLLLASLIKRKLQQHFTESQEFKI